MENDNKKEVTVEELADLIQRFDQLALDGEWNTLDDMIAELDYKNEPIAVVICYIRCLYPYRIKLLWWGNLIRDYARYLDEVGKAKKTILKGLEEFYE